MEAFKPLLNRRAHVSVSPSKECLVIGKLGVPELLMIFGIALLIFGPRKLGDLGKGLGEGIRSFKSAITDPAPDDKTVAVQQQPPR